MVRVFVYSDAKEKGSVHSRRQIMMNWGITKEREVFRTGEGPDVAIRVDLRKKEEEEEEVVVAGLTGGGGKGVDVKVGFIRVAGAGGGNPPTFNPFR